MTAADVIRFVHWRILLVCQLFALALYASWSYPPFAVAWKGLDFSVFKALDGYLRTHPGTHTFWALMNHRIVDYVGAAFFVCLFIFAARRSPSLDRGRWLARGIALAVLLLVILDISEGVVFHFESPSPTLAVEGAFRLTQAVPWVNAKDSSSASFPGDHGTAVLLFSAALWYFGGRRIGLVAVCGSALLLLPRLVAGAHWLSDIAVGSTAAAVGGVGLVYALHLHRLAENLVFAFVRPLADLLARRRDTGWPG